MHKPARVRQPGSEHIDQDGAAERAPLDAHLSSFFTAAPVGLVILDSDLRYLFINETLAKMNGLPPEQHLGKTVEEVIPELAPTLVPIGRRVLATGRAEVSLKATGRTFGDRGAERHWMMSTFPLFGASGEGPLIGGMVVEVTDDERAEQVVRATERRLDVLDTLTRLGVFRTDPEGRTTYVNERWCEITGLNAEEALGDGWLAALPAEERESARRGWMVLVRAGLPCEHVREFEHLGRGNTWAVIRAAPELQDGKVTGYIGTLTEITAQKEAEATVRSLLRISEKLNSTLEVDELLHELVSELTKWMGVKSGCAGLRNSEGMFCHEYLCQDRFVAFEYLWPPGVGWPGWVLVHRVPYLCNDASSDSVIVPGVRERTKVRSGITAPMLDRHGEVLGFFAVYNREFAAPDEDKMAAFAQVASIAIQNALAYRKIKLGEAQLRQLSGRLLKLRDEEQRRIARELHDTTGQNLAALKMNLARMMESKALKPEARKLLSESLALARQTTQEVRTLSYALHPPLLDEAGLGPALRWYAKGFSERSGIRVELELPEDSNHLPREVETALFRIVQECLANVHRHSGSPTAKVRLVRAPAAVVLEVQDQGCAAMSGRPPAGPTGSPPVGVGIASIQERAKQLGGRLKIHSGSEGTTVWVLVPLPEATQ